jgi:4-amino-4-deoxy-L-arabinose transferase-like glycosyltransferase
MHYSGFIILALAVLVFFANLWGPSIYILDEAKNASCAMEMLANRTLVVPTFNGELRTDKPPLHYYFMMLAYSVAGITPGAARFFSALCGVATVWLVYRVTSRHFNARTAFYSALALVSSLQVAIQFHLAVPDPYLILFFTLAMVLLYGGLQGSARSMVLFYPVLGLACLAKGLLAPVMAGLVCIIFILLSPVKFWDTLKQLRLPVGLLLFGLVTIPWYAAVGWATDGEWLRGFFIDHNVNRFSSTLEGHGGFIGAPLVVAVLGLFPLAVVLPHAILVSWKNRAVVPWLAFSLSVAGAIILFFTVSRTFLPGYVAPAFPFLAVCIGYFINMQLESSSGYFRSLSFKGLQVVYILFCASVPVGIYMGLSSELPSTKELAVSYLILPACGLLGSWKFAKEKVESGFMWWSGSWIAAIIIFFYITYPAVDEYNPVKQSQGVLSRYTNHATFGNFNPAFVFQYGGPIRKLKSEDEVREFVKQHPNGIILTSKRAMAKLPDDLEWVVQFRQKDTFERSETILITGLSNKSP